MVAGVLKEPSFENRVSLLPDNISTLIKKSLTMWVETSAGVQAYCTDDDYAKNGAVIKSRDEILSGSDILLSIHPDEIPGNLQHKILIGVYQPLQNPPWMRTWTKCRHTAFSLDMLPRTTRAQSMDVLSSQANVAGYKAVLLAANLLPHYFPMFITAAGSIPPVKLLILGAGVAGLQAIATARRLGAVVEVFDTRPAVKEEVTSLGGKFIEVEGAADTSSSGGYAVEQTTDFLQKQKAKIAESIARADVVITTAQIPGKPAPVLITTEMIEHMKKGSVIIDLASATGGNTELTKDNETVTHEGVRIVGNSSLPSTVPYDASKMYGKNLSNFLLLITNKDGQLILDFKDELVSGTCMIHDGEIVNERIKQLMAV